MNFLRPGQTVTTSSGQPCTVVKFLGGGGQGEVYSASWGNAPVALKWYSPETATPTQRKALKYLVDRPAPSDAFLWPLDIATSDNIKTYGYVMPLRDERFSGLTALVKGKVDASFRVLVNFGLGLVSNMLKLHAQGLCYRDINFGNAFFDPKTGEALICDNDNVTTNRNKDAQILGTPDFMAPELVRGDVSAVPDLSTDLHSLAVLLFYIFHQTHPLIGKRQLAIKSWDLPARRKMLGREPLFIFDPKDRSNEPVDQAVDPLKTAGHFALIYWPIYPQFLRDIFTQAFTAGLHDPSHARVRESQWIDTLSKLRDSIFRCKACNRENFHDISSDRPCWRCKAAVSLPPRIKIGKATVCLSADSRLYEGHLVAGSSTNPLAVAAEVVAHPSSKEKLGLRNCTTVKWIANVLDASGKRSQIEIEPRKSLMIMPGVTVNFGTASGEIIA